MSGPKVIFFDMNETLLDLSALDPQFERRFGDRLARERWFHQLQALWLATMTTGQFFPFDRLAGAALTMLAEREGVDLPAGERDGIVHGVTQLPPYPDVHPALRHLKEQGFRLFVLTNGTQKALKAQLQSAKLEAFLEDAFSVESVQRYKPAPEPYRWAAGRVGVAPDASMMVAAHAWDIAGAHAVGMQTAFVRRPRQVLSPLQHRPDWDVADLDALAQELAADA